MLKTDIQILERWYFRIIFENQNHNFRPKYTRFWVKTFDSNLKQAVNSPGANGVLNAIFPFWAKMKTVIAASCDDFSKNFRTWNQDHRF